MLLCAVILTKGLPDIYCAYTVADPHTRFNVIPKRWKDALQKGRRKETTSGFLTDKGEMAYRLLASVSLFEGVAFCDRSGEIAL